MMVVTQPYTIANIHLTLHLKKGGDFVVCKLYFNEVWEEKGAGDSYLLKDKWGMTIFPRKWCSRVASNPAT